MKLTGFLDWWLQIEEITEFSRLREVLVMEQLLNACSPELRVWLNERHPRKLTDMVELADHYLVTHKKSGKA